MSASVLNSGTVGVGDTDVAGVEKRDVTEASDIMETVPVKELATNIFTFCRIVCLHRQWVYVNPTIYCARKTER